LGITWAALPDTGLPDEPWCLTVSDTALFAGDEYGVYISTDGGTKWSAIDSGIVDYVMSITTVGNHVIVGTEYDGIYVWSNNEANWTKDTTGIPYDSTWSEYARISNLVTNGENIYGTASLETSPCGIIVSTNSGVSWKTVNTGLTDSNVTALVTSGSALFAGTKTGGVFLSTNDGVSWSSVSQGLIDKEVISIVASRINLFAGTGSGVWRRPLSEMITAVKESGRTIPSRFLLSQNYPNPFNPSTTIRYSVPGKSFVTLSVYDVLGQLVKTLVSNEKNRGSYEASFGGSSLPSGTYFYTLRAGSYAQTKKMVLLK
jgi:hypothetical protein